MNSTWHVPAYNLLQQKELAVQNTLRLAVVAVAARCRPRVFATVNVFASAVFTRCLRAPTCLRDEACLHLTCFREVSSRARVFAGLSSGSVFVPPHVFATTRVFARPVFGTCLRTPTCLHDDVCLRLACLRDVFSLAHVSSRRRVPSPDLGSAIVFSHADGFTPASALARALRSGSVFGRPRVFAGTVSADAHVSLLSSPGMCLLTPRCLRRLCFEASVLDPMCLQNVSSVFGQYVHPPVTAM